MASIKFVTGKNGEKQLGIIIGSAWKAKNDCISLVINRGSKEGRLSNLELKPGDRMLIAPRKKNKEKDPDFVVFSYPDNMEGDAPEA